MSEVISQQEIDDLLQGISSSGSHSSVPNSSSQLSMEPVSYRTQRNSIEQNIIHAVEISKYIKIPVLFMSNPGLGKTTILKRYAAKYNYHLEVLIGSRFTPEEISGYQVNNGGDHLQHLNPEWFNRILQQSNEGKRTLLFIDELSTCSEFVQGALLSLIFDRTIGNGKFLPDDCFIVAAANYAGNLPDTMGLMAPTLNRFIIINLNDNYNALDLIQEFLNPPKPAEYPQSVKKITPEFKEQFMQRFQNCWREIFFKYSNPKSSLGYLDISNTNLNDIYNASSGSVYNFISGRSLSYLSKALLAYYALNLKNDDLFTKIIDGLVGAGSCLFSIPNQAKLYRNFVYENMKFCVENSIQSSDTNHYKLTNDISKDISAYITGRDNIKISQTEDITQLSRITRFITDQMDPSNLSEIFSSSSKTAKFLTDYNSIIELLKILFQTNTINDNYWKLYQLATDYYGYYCDILSKSTDYANFFGCYNQIISRIYIVRIIRNGVPKFIRAASVFQNKYLYIMGSSDYYANFNPTPDKQIKTDDVEVLTVSHNNVKFVPLKSFVPQLVSR